MGQGSWECPHVAVRSGCECPCVSCFVRSGWNYPHADRYCKAEIDLTLTGQAGTVMSTGQPGTVMLRDQAGTVMSTGQAGAVMLTDQAENVVMTGQACHHNSTSTEPSSAQVSSGRAGPGRTHSGTISIEMSPPPPPPRPDKNMFWRSWSSISQSQGERDGRGISRFGVC